MSLMEPSYGVLVVSSTEKFNNSIKKLLSSSKYEPVHFVSSVNEARRKMASRKFDFVMVNMPLPDESGVEFAIDCSSSLSTVVLLFVKKDIHEEVHYKVFRHGVFTLGKPTSNLAVKDALNWMESSREGMRRVETKNLTLKEKMEEIRLVNRAKWILIDKLSMTEDEAHYFINRKAMDLSLSKGTIAEGIIKEYK